jgi:hypothetical protein
MNCTPADSRSPSANRSTRDQFGRVQITYADVVRRDVTIIVFRAVDTAGNMIGGPVLLKG